MRTYLAFLAAAAFTVAPALAQQQSAREGIAQLKSVKGNVLLSREAGLATGGEAARLMDKTRVITTANAEVVVMYDNGCEVRLKENQRFEVDSRKPCEALILSVESILVQPVGLAAAGGAAGFWPIVPVLGGIAIGVAIGNGGGSSPPPTPLSPS